MSSLSKKSKEQINIYKIFNKKILKMRVQYKI